MTCWPPQRLVGHGARPHVPGRRHVPGADGVRERRARRARRRARRRGGAAARVGAARGSACTHVGRAARARRCRTATSGASASPARSPVAPRFLLLDEPAAGLDDAESLRWPRRSPRIRDELGCGVLLVEHDMRIIFRRLRADPGARLRQDARRRHARGDQARTGRWSPPTSARSGAQRHAAC